MELYLYMLCNLGEKNTKQVFFYKYFQSVYQYLTNTEDDIFVKFLQLFVRTVSVKHILHICDIFVFKCSLLVELSVSEKNPADP